MKSFATIILFTASALSGVQANEFNLKSFSNPVSTLKFGGNGRRRVGDNEQLTLTLANGEDVVLALAPSEELRRRIDSCGSYSVAGSAYDVIVTGCEGEDRSITIGGEGSWTYDISSESFRRLEGVGEDSPQCSREPSEDDVDAMIMKKTVEDAEASGDLIEANLEQRSQFQMEIRYYYDQSLLERYNGDHATAIRVIKEMHEHTKVMMRHPTIGRAIHIEYSVEPMFASALRTHAGPSMALEGFMAWLNPQGLCREDIAFHHLITNRRQDGTAGVAWVGSVCHGGCFNTGITEVWQSALEASHTLAHELGHNIGAHHTFDVENEGRNCDGIMSYGDRPRIWSQCSKDSWTSDYDVFVRSFGQSRADQCFKPTSQAPVPSPTPARPASPAPPAPTPTPANPPAGSEWEQGYCTVDGRDQTAGVIKISSQNMGSESIREQCLEICGLMPGATGCEVVWNLQNRGCYVHTQPITEASGGDFHLCAIFGRSTPAAPTPTPAAPAPTPAAPAPTPVVPASTPSLPADVSIDWTAGLRGDASVRALTLTPGSVLTFEFNGRHTVHMMQSARALEICNFGTGRQIGSGQAGQSTSLRLRFPPNVRPGSKFYFACAVGQHCNMGMRLTVTIANQPTPATPTLPPVASPTQPPVAPPTQPPVSPPTQPPVAPPTQPPAPVCECVGATNPLGEGGENCDSFDADSAQQWCYTSPNACEDGKPSTVLSGHEWSYTACQ